MNHNDFFLPLNAGLWKERINLRFIRFFSEVNRNVNQSYFHIRGFEPEEWNKIALEMDLLFNRYQDDDCHVERRKE
jgi:hypothetical protein